MLQAHSVDPVWINKCWNKLCCYKLHIGIFPVTALTTRSHYRHVLVAVIESEKVGFLILDRTGAYSRERHAHLMFAVFQLCSMFIDPV